MIGRPRAIASRTASAAAVLWLAALALPAVTVFAPAHDWDVPPLPALIVTLSLFAVLRLLVPQRLFVVLTYPLALFGLLAVAAEAIRNANLLELAMVGATQPREIAAVFGAYAAPVTALATVLAALAWLAAGAPVDRASGPTMRRRAAAAAALALGGCVIALYPAAAMRAWPVNVVTVMAAEFGGRPDLLATLLPYAQTDPRQAGRNWGAHRIAGASPPAPETYVLVIGESVRADRLRACGGPRPIGPGPDDALVFCDMTSSSSSTHTSVPLLISRELPGASVRVSSDASFMHAFEEAGFATSWLSVQEKSIAWPDAAYSAYITGDTPDRAALLEPLRRRLAEGGDRQLIVLHARNAHFPYCNRYARGDAVVPVDCAKLQSVPDVADRALWLAAYDNAVHESLLFLDAVHELARSRGGEVFVAYTSDHGENLFDDSRGLFMHALSEPTRWDTRVPFIVYANSAWRERNARAWAGLRANERASMMHADVVPTLLGAAGIAYDEPRHSVADLTRASPPHRTRFVLKRMGYAIDGDKLN